MKPEVLNAIAAFFEATKLLRDLGVIRSDKYLGDLGEYICQHFYEIQLAISGRQVGYDGTDKDGNVQVKYHGSSTKTNIDFGNPDHYKHVLVVFGPASLLRPLGRTEDFLIYRISADDVRGCQNAATGTFSCGKSMFEREPDNVLELPKPNGLR